MKNHHGQNRSFIAIIFIAFGLLLLAKNFELFNFDFSIAKWWPLILIIIGLKKLFSDKLNKKIAIIFLVLGLIFLSNNFGFFDNFNWNLSDIFWPLIFVFIGLSIFFKSPFHRNRKSNETLIEKSNEFDYFIIFGGSKNHINSTDVKRGRATAIFGGLEINLLNAKIQENEIVIELTVIFGGIDLKIPSNWKIVQKGIPIFGGFDDKRTNVGKFTEKSPIVYIDASIVFGGVTIVN